MARAATTTDVFNAIAEAKRREMIGLLNNGKYWTVSEIVGRMKITQPTASKHLRVLRKVGIVSRYDGSGADAGVRRLPVSTRQASQEKAA